MDQKEFERGFKPSGWHPTLDADTVIENFVQKIQSISNRVRGSVPFQADIPYGPGERMKYDLYGSNLPENSPLFIFIHGGYWTALSKEESAVIVQPMVNLGVRVAVIGYDLCPDVLLEDILKEIREGLSQILEKAGKEKCPKVYIAGHSVGAHMALSMLQKENLSSLPNSSLIKNVFLLAGIYDLTEARNTEEANPNNILGLTDENINQLSPLLSDFGHLKEVLPNLKIFVIVSEFDAREFVAQGKKLFEKLKDQTNAEYVFCNGLDHFDVKTQLDDPEFKITKLIIENL